MRLLPLPLDNNSAQASEVLHPFQRLHELARRPLSPACVIDANDLQVCLQKLVPGAPGVDWSIDMESCLVSYACYLRKVVRQARRLQRINEDMACYSNVLYTEYALENAFLLRFTVSCRILPAFISSSPLPPTTMRQVQLPGTLGLATGFEYLCNLSTIPNRGLVLKAAPPRH